MAGYVVKSGGGFSAGTGRDGWKAWSVWGAAALFYLFEFFVRVAPSVMEPELQKTFHMTAGALGGALGVYYYLNQ